MLHDAKEAPAHRPCDLAIKGLAPRTPPQLSPVKPRRAAAAQASEPSLSGVTALTAELNRLAHSDSRGGLTARSLDTAAADWESLPLDIWGLVWRYHLDLSAQMALCLTSTKWVSHTLHMSWRTAYKCFRNTLHVAHHSQAAAQLPYKCARLTAAGPEDCCLTCQYHQHYASVQLCCVQVLAPLPPPNLAPVVRLGPSCAQCLLRGGRPQRRAAPRQPHCVPAGARP